MDYRYHEGQSAARLGSLLVPNAPSLLTSTRPRQAGLILLILRVLVALLPLLACGPAGGGTRSANLSCCQPTEEKTHGSALDALSRATEELEHGSVDVLGAVTAQSDPKARKQQSARSEKVVGSLRRSRPGTGNGVAALPTLAHGVRLRSLHRTARPSHVRGVHENGEASKRQGTETCLVRILTLELFCAQDDQEA